MLEKDLGNAKGKIVDVANKALETANVQISHLYPSLDLGELDLFKVVKDDQLVVDEKNEPNQQVTPSS